MAKRRKPNKNKEKKTEQTYAHNPRYSMTVPDARHPDEDTVSTGQS